MRKKIVAGNWKMNNNLEQTKELIKGIKKGVRFLNLKNTRILVAPTAVNLKTAVKKLKKSKIEVTAQNMHQAENGAFTGEISANMLFDIGIKTVIIGHSERREYFAETDEILSEKVNTALKNDLEVIFCFGEKWEDRKSEDHFNVVERQLKNALFNLQAKEFKNIILAYEPVWAIGTGQTATANQAQEMHNFVRKLLVKQYNEKVANSIPILYGGSVKPSNAKEIFDKPDVDGGLIGGASLKAEDFTEIIKAI